MSHPLGIFPKVDRGERGRMGNAVKEMCRCLRMSVAVGTKVARRATNFSLVRQQAGAVARAKLRESNADLSMQISFGRIDRGRLPCKDSVCC